MVSLYQRSEESRWYFGCFTPFICEGGGEAVTPVIEWRHLTKTPIPIHGGVVSTCFTTHQDWLFCVLINGGEAFQRCRVEMWCYNIQLNRWWRGCIIPWDGRIRRGSTLSYLNGKLYLIGGLQGEWGDWEDYTRTTTASSKVFVMTPKMDERGQFISCDVAEGPELLLARGCHTATVLGSKIVVLGGHGGWNDEEDTLNLILYGEVR